MCESNMYTVAVYKQYYTFLASHSTNSPASLKNWDERCDLQDYSTNMILIICQTIANGHNEIMICPPFLNGMQTHFTYLKTSFVESIAH